MTQDLPIDLAGYNAIQPSPADASAATGLLAELRTGLSRSGRETVRGEEAAAVAHAESLVDKARELLGSYGEARRFEIVTVSVLDHLIRPRTDRWRRWLGNERLDDRHRRQLRRELGELQGALPRVLSLLEAVRDKRDLIHDDLFMGSAIATAAPPEVRARKALQPLVTGLHDADTDFRPFFDQEKTQIAARRRGRVGGAATASNSDLADVSGLALSGGGIRSATFSLGFVQALARRGLLETFDYLSTVSGGGYFGSFLSSYLNAPTETVEELFGKLGDGGDTLGVRHLRNRSRFLVDGGAVGQFKALVAMAAGIATNLLALLPWVVVLVLVTWGLRTHTPVWGAAGAWIDRPSGLLTGESPAAVAAGLLLGVALILQLVFRPMVYFWTRSGTPPDAKSSFRSAFDSIATFATGMALVASVFASIPLIFGAFGRLRELRVQLPAVQIDLGVWAPVLVAILPLLSGPLASHFRNMRFLGSLLRIVFVVSGPLFLLGLYLVLGSTDFAAWSCGGFLVVVIVVVFLFWFMDLNALSPHNYYRERLADCYVVRRKDGGVEPVKKQKLSELGRGTDAPFHLINTTVNLPGSRDRELRGRKGDFFCLNKISCGSRSTRYSATTEFEEWDPTLDLATAMAVSGAAISSNMAVLKLDHLRFFLTLLNARLGYWIPNVKNLGPIMQGARKVWHRCTPGPDVLLREMFGSMRETDTFVNLSDGGHIENLGVYELLRRRAKFIVSVDGECDSDLVYDGLIKLVRYARIDLGVTIDIDVGEVTAAEDGYSRAHSVLGKITYQDGSIGWLLYAKLSLTGDEPIDVLDYRREEPRFPHQSTLDQIYEEKQFEAYRALGQHVAEELFREEILARQGEDFHARSERGETDFRLWFDGLVREFLPESDPVFRADPTNLDGLKVGLSVSNSPGEPAEAVNEATLAICKALIAKGSAVVLGHDWREGGVMHEIARFAKNDRLLNKRGDVKPACLNRFVQGGTAPPEDLPANLFDIQPVSSLIELREQLTQLSDARVCLGGKVDGFSGPIPGVLEEAWRAARGGQTVLISQALGGACGWLAKSLLEEKPGPLPKYDEQKASEHGLPSTPDELIADFEAHFRAVPAELGALHRRLWKTTTLDAATAHILEVLDLTNNPAPRIG